jgi:Tfp pilus assembly protein PilN
MRINLLPPEVLERQRMRRRTLATVVVGLIVLGAIAAFYFLKVAELGTVEEEIATQQARNAQLQQQIAELQDIAALQQEIERTRVLLNGLLADEVLWSQVLRDISLVIPSQAWLEGLTGQTAAAAGGETDVAVTTTTGTVGEGIIGQISFNGKAFSHQVVAEWLSRLEDVRGFINPWLSSSTKTGGDDPVLSDVVSFTSSVDLSEQALARRAAGPDEGGEG